jgi:hypothetical protein
VSAGADSFDAAVSWRPVAAGLIREARSVQVHVDDVMFYEMSGSGVRAPVPAARSVPSGTAGVE